jgi:hypothetical protein
MDPAVRDAAQDNLVWNVEIDDETERRALFPAPGD